MTAVLDAPLLPGLTPVQLLGRGGFASVYLYEQRMPRRRVAVKVLSLDMLGEGTQRAFEAEANRMASLSSHPSIVTIHEAATAPDGRPYIVMEYCPRPNLQQRIKDGRLRVADALRIGVLLSGAVESAHRADVLHRDIKPANVLFTEYERPALADFGIAGTLTDSARAEGLSVPWSPPEALDGATADTRIDVYALGATLYAMLMGTAPFHLPGGPNGQRDQMERIRAMRAPEVHRDDVPGGLRRAIARALEKDPAARQVSALEFAYDLQHAEDGLDLARTGIELQSVVEERRDDRDDGEGTHVRGIVRIQPVEAPRAQAHQPTLRMPEEPDTQLVRPGSTASSRDEPELTTPQVADTVRVVRPAEGREEAAPLPTRRRRLAPILIGGAAAVLAAGVAAAALLPHDDTAAGTDRDAGSTAGAPADALGGVPVPQVEGLTGVRSGDSVRFSWRNPDPATGDRYLVASGAPDADPTPREVSARAVRVPREQEGSTCIAVTLVRSDGRAADEPARKCVS